ncbi:hypothetical protein MML48_1g17434 [Holotrichia oblita]|uniref:Uncharacterized protein n=1 Tax=Holotrichia oblita TaxID=644536 RepID=A0ACB9TRP2_HOLOL|nr:hypothetical protein MML48_1g17434 [Holotrichia oblita]
MEFKISGEIPDNVFKESFRLNRKQFREVHELIKQDITGQECNAQKPIGSEEKLAVCLRYLATGDMFKTIAMRGEPYQTLRLKYVKPYGDIYNSFICLNQQWKHGKLLPTNMKENGNFIII